MTWNIKGEASLGWNNNYKVVSEVVDKIIDQETHIIVLTAFVVARGLDYLFERLHSEGYIWFISNRSGKNGILIAIKKELVDYKKLIENIYKENSISSVIAGCNILQVSFPLKCGKSLDIVGCRMETGGFDSLQEQYDSERNVFDKVLLPVVKDRNCDLQIVCGDFNNARCLGNLKEKYCFRNYVGKAQCNYNLNIIKDSFEEIGFIIIDIDENGNSFPTHNGYIPDDHIFVHGGKCEECTVISAEGLSDHDIVKATVNFEC